MGGVIDGTNIVAINKNAELKISKSPVYCSIEDKLCSKCGEFLADFGAQIWKH